MHVPTATRGHHLKPQVLRWAVIERQSWTLHVLSLMPSVVSVTPMLGNDGWYCMSGDIFADMYMGLLIFRLDCCS